MRSHAKHSFLIDFLGGGSGQEGKDGIKEETLLWQTYYIFLLCGVYIEIYVHTIYAYTQRQKEVQFNWLPLPNPHSTQIFGSCQPISVHACTRRELLLLLMFPLQHIVPSLIGLATLPFYSWACPGLTPFCWCTIPCCSLEGENKTQQKRTVDWQSAEWSIVRH